MFDKSRLGIHGYSKVSQILFKLISNLDILKDDIIYYAEHNREYQIFTSTGNLYYLDFYDKTLNLCIEFNGNAFHPNPKKYKETDLFKAVFDKEEKLVKWYWEKEKTRIKELKDEFDIDTIIVWEDEFNGKTIPDFLYNKLIQLKNGI